MSSSGIVYLVGAGPGDPGLFTLRGKELLEIADVVLYDALVSPELLRLAREDAEIIYVGKRSRDHAVPQEELNLMIARKAKEGNCVVRLKGGDPFTFGRGGEEAQELKAQGVRFEIVPGVSSVTAAPAYAGIPITHRDHCSSYEVITGHERPGKESSSLDWGRIAKNPATKIILMGVERIGEIASSLQENGMADDTPVGMVRWGTTGRQQTLTGTLGSIAEKVRETGFKAPAVTVVGSVVNLREALNWYENRPLFSRRIVVTRTRTQASQLSRRLQEAGASILEIPTIKIVEPTVKEPLVEAIAGLNAYDWLVFTSPNGVDAFFNYFFKAFEDLRDIGGLRIAAVGPATAAKLADYKLKINAMPERYVASDVADAIGQYESVENLKILLMRAEVANPELPKRLEEMGGIVDDIACYRTVAETEDKNGAAQRLVNEGADWITFTSSSTVEHFHARFDLPDLLETYPELRVASIGPETTKAIEALELKPDIEADEHTIKGLAQAILRAELV